MFGNIAVFILVGIFLFDKVVMFLYCRFMERLDEMRRMKRQLSEDNNEIEKKDIQKSKFKRIAIFMVDHFLYGWMRYSVLMTGRIPSHHFRNVLYRFIYNMKITKNTVIYGGCEIRSPWNFHADNCVLSNNCIIDAREGVYLGQYVVFGGGVHIWTQEHDVDSVNFTVTEDHCGKVEIEQWAWICSDSTILPGTHVGQGAVLASRACATNDLEPYGIYVGVPARKKRERNNDIYYTLSGRPHWYFY